MVPTRKAGRSGESGQAAVEAALTLPLTIFLILGTLQLFLMLQGRILAEYAAFRAVRAGSIRHGACRPMTHSAILALMPSFYSFMGGAGGSPADRLATAFRARSNNRYAGAQDGGHNGAIVWVVRDAPTNVRQREDLNFDQPPDNPNAAPRRLEIRLVYFFPLKIPFANRMISLMALAHWGWRSYTGVSDPLMPVQTANWRQQQSISLESAIRGEVLGRFNRQQYVMPIHASASLRMMTPARSINFVTQNCSPAPETL